MTLDEIKKLLSGMATGMDDTIDKVNARAIEAQTRIFNMIIKEIENFEISNGSYVTGQDYTAKIAEIESKMYGIIAKVYNPAVYQYLKHYNAIETSTIQQHADYNGIEVDKQKLTPIKQSLYNQSSYYLTEGLADAYVQPAKFVLMQYVTKGSPVKDLRSAIERWDKGTMNAGELASDRHAPRLQAYATQIARDSMYTYAGTMQDVIRKEHGLTKFIYVGGLVKDSRPFCRHLVMLRRKIDIEEIPPLVVAYPDGLKPDTTKKNFPLYRGGYACRHTVMFVK